MSILLAFSKFHTIQEAEPLIELLKRENIPYSIDHEKEIMDGVYIGQNFDPLFELKIPSDKFEYVHSIIDAELGSAAAQQDPTHYLYSFSDEEIKNVLNNSEWNHFDQTLAKKILSERGINPDLFQAETDLLSDFKPDKPKTWVMIVGYVLAFVFPLIGIFIGLSFMNSTKTLRNGQQVKLYDLPSIKHGQKIFAISLIFLLFYLYSLLKRSYHLTV